MRKHGFLYVSVGRTTTELESSTAVALKVTK
jgi:hypothetical protein